ncbi:hypothetical protein SpCBS45565_g04368 [Spizellomyces sp. 'palustris']|nr:hypothetical protein SpCBS45565_g04368 [Spizellomyces sp. 'palustris']
MTTDKDRYRKDSIVQRRRSSPPPVRSSSVRGGPRRPVRRSPVYRRSGSRSPLPRRSRAGPATRSDVARR